MSSEKWNTLLNNTNRLTTPAMQKEILSAEECELFLDLIAKSTQQFAKEKKPYNGLKVFTKGVQDVSQNEPFIENPPQDNESLKEWSTRSFKGEPFGFIMNFLENYNNTIVEEMAKKVAPLIAELGYPFAGLSMLYFMGDYGYTPFGVHRGSAGEDGVLFHLGPATKTFYIWETDEYNRLTNHATSYKNVEEILHAATAYILEPGDAISFPDDMYHVANTEEFSVSLVLDYRRASQGKVKELIINELLQVNPDNDTLLNHIPPSELLQTLNFQNESEQAVKRLMSRLKSNGGFMKPSILSYSNLDLQGTYQLKKPFSLELLPLKKQQSTVFARGHEIIIENNKELLDFINLINTGAPINLATLNIGLQPETLGFDLFQFLMKVDETEILRKL
ncbi:MULTISPECIES: cupin domain-containing protein [Flavobacterium]|uniref:Cupin domain-containing protein n=1 Tax=Flavobacterium jumunjinense TaxID=998845 RepID=A0ABV5GLP0_9FLAO|nr:MULTISPECIES: cupin domain-containing protein [Flavobacterium]